MEMDIEVGDIIKLKENLVTGEFYGDYKFSKVMDGMQGSLYEVRANFAGGFEVKDYGYVISPEMIYEVIKRDPQPQPQKEYRMELEDSKGDTLKAQEMIALMKDVELEGEEKNSVFYLDIPENDLDELTEMTLTIMNEIFISIDEVAGEDQAIGRFGEILSRFIEEREEIHTPSFVEALRKLILDSYEPDNLSDWME